MGERGSPKVRKINQRLVRHLPHLSYSFDARSEQRNFDAGRKSDFANRRVVRKLWRWFKLVHCDGLHPDLDNAADAD
jgi:hypothetical protein